MANDMRSRIEKFKALQQERARLEKEGKSTTEIQRKIERAMKNNFAFASNKARRRAEYE